jgi:LmbE family N-acetylglucosaminyl deacetylase
MRLLYFRVAVTPEHVFLQPHFDDVALSCGGLVAALAAAGHRVRVVTVCGAAPLPGLKLSDFARALHATARFKDAPTYVRARRKEDHAAAAALGDGVTVEHCELRDAIYRLDGAYDSPERLSYEPLPSDPMPAQVRDLVVELRRRAPHATFYGPLAVGGHVDHRITCRAVVQTGPAILYEDYPYAAVPGALDARVAQAGPLQPIVVDVTDTFDRRIAAIRAYASQLPSLFPDGHDEADVRRIVGEFAAARAETPGRYAERIWGSTLPSYSP